jgi:hypothetical protein
MLILEDQPELAPQLETINSRVERLLQHVPVIMSTLFGVGGRKFECDTRLAIFSHEDYYFAGMQRKITDPAPGLQLPVTHRTEISYLGPDAELFYLDEVRPSARLLSAIGIIYSPPRDLEDENIVWDARERCHKRQASPEFTQLMKRAETVHNEINWGIIALVCEKAGDVLIDRYQAQITE